MFEDIEFVPEDEMKKPLAAGTEATIQVRADRDGTLGEFRTGESKFGKWMLVPFEVVDGEHHGAWASLMLSVSGTDRKFRRVFQAVTGVDLTQGATVSFGDFKEQLISGVFEAKLGPEKRQGKETGFTTVVELGERVGERDNASASAPAIAATPEPVPAGAGDEDIPF